MLTTVPRPPTLSLPLLRRERGHDQLINSTRSCLPAPLPDYVMFTYNDYQSGQNKPPYPPGPSFLRGIR